MVLAVASAGYAQIMKSSKTDYRPKAERIMKPSRVESMETLQNVQPQDNLLRVEGEELQQTFYDWQTNDAARTWTINWNNGKVDFGFTTAADAAFNTRGTGIVSYDGNTGTWSSSEGRVENEKTGFGTIARYGENGLVVAAHTATECHVYVTDDRESVTAESMAPTSALDNITQKIVSDSLNALECTRIVVILSCRRQNKDFAGTCRTRVGFDKTLNGYTCL